MIIGYAFAVIVGFVFTADGNWTNRPTPTGMTLAAIAGSGSQAACWFGTVAHARCSSGYRIRARGSRRLGAAANRGRADAIIS